MNMYTEGDQIKYIQAYNNMESVPLLDAFTNYSLIIGSLEVGYFLIIWFASNLGISKILLIGCINSLLASLLVNLLLKYNVSIFVILTLIFGNFYFIALYTELERLKFGFLFFVIALTLINKKKYFYFFSSLSLINHTQFLLFYTGFFLGSLIPSLRGVLNNFKVGKSLVFVNLLLLAIFTFFMQEHIITKATFYFSNINFLSFLKSCPLIFLAYFYSKKDSMSFAVLLILAIGVLLLGGDRINIFIYFSFLYYGLQVNRGLNFGILITSLYFTFKGILFINNIMDYGRGY